MENAGKTHFMYNGLAGSNFKEIADDIGETRGFNCETIVGSRLSYTLWDIGGSLSQRSLWPMYLKSIQSQIIIYMVNVNDSIERLRASKNLLLSLLSEVELRDVKLLLLLNKRQNTQGSESWHENPFKRDQLV